MASATAQLPKARRRWPLPRFSLAAALFAMTLCAVGLWYWYRVPFEVAHHHGHGGFPWRRGQLSVEYESVRRTWGGTIRHGPRRIFVDDKCYFLENYRDGSPHGKWEWLNGAGRATITAEFRRGKLVSFQASPECDQRLARHLAEGTIQDQRVARELLTDARADCTETPFKDALQVLQDVHRVPFECIDLARAADRAPSGSDRPATSIDMPITCYADGPLIEVLGKMLQPHDLVCDYRYGMLWVTERDEAEHWKDPTGVSEIVPPRGSRLAAQWEAPATMHFIETPLADAFRIVEDMNGVKFDTSPAPDSIVHSSRITVTLYVSGLQLKHCLGALLDRVDCQARLNGETIVVDLQPDHPEAQYR